MNVELSEYDIYVLEWELKLRISAIESLRDKCGINPDDMESEPNQHIQSINKFLAQIAPPVK